MGDGGPSERITSCTVVHFPPSFLRAAIFPLQLHPFCSKIFVHGYNLRRRHTLSPLSSPTRYNPAVGYTLYDLFMQHPLQTVLTDLHHNHTQSNCPSGGDLRRPRDPGSPNEQSRTTPTLHWGGSISADSEPETPLPGQTTLQTPSPRLERNRKSVPDPPSQPTPFQPPHFPTSP